MTCVVCKANHSPQGWQTASVACFGTKHSNVCGSLKRKKKKSYQYCVWTHLRFRQFIFGDGEK